MPKKKLSFSNEREVFRGKKFIVSQFEAKLGKKSQTWEMIEALFAPRSVKVIPFDGKGNFYLVSEYCYPLRREEITAVKGGAGKGSTLSQAKLELADEAGITAGKMRKMAELTSLPGYFRHKADVYLAEELSFSKKRSLGELEIVRVLKIPVKTAVKMCETGKISESSTVSAIFLAERILRKEGKL